MLNYLRCYFILSVCLLQGCASYSERSASMISAWSRGDVVAAEKWAVGLHQDSPARDKVLTAMELGSVRLAVGDVDGSIMAFNEAEFRINEYERKGKVSVSAETMSLFYNQTALPYRGSDYDKIMINAYKALDYLKKGDSAGARVELRRAYENQVSAVQNNSKEIQRDLDEIKETEAQSRKDGTSYDATRAAQDPRVKSQLASIYGDLNTPSPYGDFVNPFVEYLRGIFFLYTWQDESDLETARKSFEKTVTLVPDNVYVLEDYKVANETAGNRLPQVAYIIFETGRAPSKQEERIDIPLFVVSENIPYVGIALPKLVKNPDYVSSLEVIADGQAYRTQLLADMDAIVNRDFNSGFSVILLRSCLSMGVKATAQYFLMQQIKDDGWRFVANFATSIAQAAMNRADLRTWRTLPKQFQLARVPVRENMQIELAVRETGAKMSVNIPNNQSCIIFVKSMSRQSGLIVQTMTLTP